MPSSRANHPPRQATRSSASSSRTSTNNPPASSSSRPPSQAQFPALRPPTNTLLTTIQQQAHIPSPQFPPTPAAVFGSPGGGDGSSSSASHAHLAGSIDQAFTQYRHHQQQQSSSNVTAATTTTTGSSHHPQQHHPPIPPVGATSIHSPTYSSRLEIAERERINQASRVLGSRELLMRYAVLNNESIPQTRLRFQKQLVGIKHVPYQPPAPPPGSSSSSASTSSATKAASTAAGAGAGAVLIARDMRPDEDVEDKGTWAEGAVVVGPGPLVVGGDAAGGGGGTGE